MRGGGEDSFTGYAPDADGVQRAYHWIPNRAQRTRTLRQVTQPSSFSNSEMSTVTTR